MDGKTDRTDRADRPLIIAPTLTRSAYFISAFLRYSQF